MTEQLDYIFFICGLGFIVFAAVCFFSYKNKKQFLPWKLLGLFGLIYGLSEFLDLLAFSLGDSSIFKVLRIFFLAASFICLVEFARLGTKAVTSKCPGRWVTLTLFMIGCTGWLYGWGGINVFFSYSLGFVGAVWSAIVLFLARRRTDDPSDQRNLFALGILFALFAVIIGIIVSYGSSLQLFDFPIQLLRSLLAVAFAIYVWQMLGLHRIKQVYRIAFVCAMLAIICGGWFFTNYIGRSEYKYLVQHLDSTCIITAASITPDFVRGIDSVEDLKNPNYKIIKERLMKMRQASPEFRYIYLMALRNDKIIFSADSESPASEDYSPPGDEYTDAPIELRALCKGETQSAIAEYTDKWGKWISAFVPIRDDITGKQIAVMGIDYPQEAVYRSVSIHRLQVIAVTFLMLIVAFLLLYFRERQEGFIESISIGRDSLQEKEEHLSCTLDSIGDAVIATDSDGCIIRMNPVAEMLTGWSAVDAVGRPVLEVFHILNSLTRESAFNPIAEVLATGEESELAHDTIIVSKNGIERQIADSCSPIRGYEGSIIGVILVFRDVTEEYMQRKQLRESELFLSALLESIPTPVFYKNTQGRYTGLNSAFEAFFGKSKEELIGKSVFDINPIELARVYHEKDVELFEHQGMQVYDSQVKNAYGEVRDVVFHKASMIDCSGTVTGLVGVVLDITERKQVEEALARSESENRLLVDNAVSGIAAHEIVLDSSGNPIDYIVLSTNPSFEKLTGLDENDVIDRRVTEIIPGYDHTPIIDIFGKVVLTGEPVSFEQYFSPFDRHYQINAYKIGEKQFATVFLDITERKMAAETLKESESKYRLLVEYSSDFIWHVNSEGLFTYISASWERITDLDLSFIIGKSFKDFVHPDDYEACHEYLQNMIYSEVILPSPEYRIKYADGNWHWHTANVTPVFGKDNDYISMVGVSRDITELKTAVEALKESESKYRLLVEYSSDLIWHVNSESLFTYISASWERITGLDLSFIIGKSFKDFVHPDDYDACHEYLRNMIYSEVMLPSPEYRIKYADGNWHWHTANVTPVFGPDNNYISMVGVSRDVTERKQADEILARTNVELENALTRAQELALQAEVAREEAESRAVEMDYKSTHDALTGLANRREFEQQINKRIASASSMRSSFAILFMDLDKFKLVNDSLGHEIGDLLLIECGKRLKSCIRSNDVIARMGGDEFTAIISAGLDVRVSCEQAIERILDHLSRPYDIGGHRLTLGVSIGVAQYPGDGEDTQSLMKHADAAMYSAKQCGRGMARWYLGDMEAESSVLLSAENDLRRAIEKDELRVLYQPLIDLQDGSVYGFESLLRWEHPTKGMISPGLFIPLAEETGLIHSIGDYVLRTTCAQMRSWLDEGLELSHCAVNVSIAQLRQESWVDSVAAALRNTGLDANNLVIELTESDICKVEDLNALTSAITKMGVHLAIDDFGVGHSSLGRLREIQWSHVKLDGTFLRNEFAVESQAKLLRSMIAMLQEQNSKVTVEWVETEQQSIFLREMGCDYAQGYFYSRPITADQFREFAITYAKAMPHKVA